MHIIELKHKGQTTIIKLYNDCDDMPHKRWTKFMYFLTLSMGINFKNVGSYLDDLKKHIALGEKENALQIATNMGIALFNGLSGVELSSFAWAHIIYSIDDDLLMDYGNENLERVVNDLQDKGLTIGHIEPCIMAIKKKLTPNLVSVDS